MSTAPASARSQRKREDPVEGQVTSPWDCNHPLDQTNKKCAQAGSRECAKSGKLPRPPDWNRILVEASWKSELHLWTIEQWAHQKSSQILGVEQVHLHHALLQIAERCSNCKDRSQRKHQVFEDSHTLVPGPFEHRWYWRNWITFHPNLAHDSHGLDLLNSLQHPSPPCGLDPRDLQRDHQVVPWLNNGCLNFRRLKGESWNCASKNAVSSRRLRKI